MSAPLWPDALQTLLQADRAALAAALACGKRVEPNSLAGCDYRGVSLGLPHWFERLTWKRFAKCFRRRGNHVVGFNVRMDQGALTSPWTARTKHGRPVIFAPFVVESGPAGCLLNYRADNAWPLRQLRDPVVCVEGDAELLLGRTLIQAAGLRVPTPSFFVLWRSPDPLVD